MNGPGRYREGAVYEDADDTPTTPGTPIAMVRATTPPVGTVVDGPLTYTLLRAELAGLERRVLAAVLEAVRDALADARVTSDRALYDRVDVLERRARGELPTLTDS